MTITLNGKATTKFEAALNVEELLRRLGLGEAPVLVELNGLALRPREYCDSEVTEGAVVEVIRVAAGG